MLDLTFGEQVKIILSRKNMTIKELAKEIEIKTGIKMSRQNLTQRLSRDNFQEQDMRMIAEILGCSFRLDILDGKEVEKEIEKKVVAAKVVVEQPEKKFEPIREIIKEPASELEAEPELIQDPELEAVPGLETIQELEQEAVPEYKREVTVEEVLDTPIREDFRSREGEINPYSGFEYKSNTVRSHPTRIGYVQVYDRKDHKWTDMTEWAFLGFQERQKLILGRAYQEPTYLD